MKERIVLIGAGSAMFTRGLVSDIVRLGQDVEVALVDTDPEALAVAEGLSRKLIEARNAPVRLHASTDRRDVLPGATAVVCTVGVGGRRAWEQDVIIPRKYGICQPVGDSVMPGGASRALRMIPPMVRIAGDLLDLAPTALFFNYGNPMGPVCRAVRKETGAQIVGLCHGVLITGNHLAYALGAAPESLHYTAVGVNHLTWFTEVRVDGQDAMPGLRRIAAEELAQHPTAVSLDEGTAAGATPAGAERTDGNPLSWQLFQLFGAFPAVFDVHVIEFFPHMYGKPWSYYGRTAGMDEHSAEQNIARGDQIYEEMKEAAFSDRPLPGDYFDNMSGEHEQVIEIVTSIRTNAGRVYSANLPNTGQVPNLMRDAIVESPAIADSSGVRAIPQPPLPAGLVGTLATRLAWVDTIVEAALEGSKIKFIQALLLDGSVDSLETATKLADDLLSTHAQYLPQFASGGKSPL